MNSLSAEWDELLRGLSSSGITWAFMRSRTTTVHAMSHGPDVDFWIPSRDLIALIRLMRDKGFIVNSGFSRDRDSYGSGVLRFERQDFPVLEFHFGDFFVSSVRLFSECQLEKGICSEQRFNFLSPSHLFSLATIRPFLLDRLRGVGFELAREIWLDGANEEYRQDARLLAANVLGPYLTKLLESILSCGQPLGRGHTILVRAFAAFRNIKHLSYRAKIRRKFEFHLPRRGVSVGFIGVDGSGKSTLAEGLYSRLQTLGIEARYVYAGRTRGNLWFTNVLRNAALRNRHFADYANSSLSNTEKAERATFRKSWIASLTLISYWLDYLARLAPFYFNNFLHGRVIIIDRGPDDLVTVPAAPSLVRLFQALLPKPKILFFCFADPILIWKRKGEKSPEELSLRQDLYSSHVKLASSKRLVVSLDTSTTAEQNLITCVFMTVLSQRSHSGVIDRHMAKIVTEASL